MNVCPWVSEATDARFGPCEIAPLFVHSVKSKNAFHLS